MVEGDISYLELETPDSEAYANCWITPASEGYSAQCYIYGPKRGDEIFKLVQDSLQERANTTGKSVCHVYTSSNKGSLALINRNEGYTNVGKDKLGNDLFERIYSQNSNTET